MTVSAGAADNVGVQSVQFRVDGNDVGTADTSNPYSISLNTTTLSNGAHTLTAVARDTAGNTRTSAGVAVTVDNAAPSAPPSLTATGGINAAQLNWGASTDNVGVTEYRVHRSTTSGFTPSTANRIATVTTGTSYSDPGLTPGTYYYRVIAADAVGNASAASPQASAVVTNDTTAPNVAISAPAAGASIGGTVTVTATASDNVGVQNVQFRVDGNNVGSADTTSPYSVDVNTTTLTNGSHTLSAVARDAAGNTAHLHERDGHGRQLAAERVGHRAGGRRARVRHRVGHRLRLGQRRRPERAVPRGRQQRRARPTHRARTRWRSTRTR